MDSGCGCAVTLLLWRTCSGHASSNTKEIDRICVGQRQSDRGFPASIRSDVRSLRAGADLWVSGMCAHTYHPGGLRVLLSVHSNADLAAHNGDYGTVFGSRKAAGRLVHDLLLLHDYGRIVVGEKRAGARGKHFRVFIIDELGGFQFSATKRYRYTSRSFVISDQSLFADFRDVFLPCPLSRQSVGRRW